jgi:hypothetical protein
LSIEAGANSKITLSTVTAATAWVIPFAAPMSWSYSAFWGAILVYAMLIYGILEIGTRSHSGQASRGSLNLPRRFASRRYKKGSSPRGCADGRSR